MISLLNSEQNEDRNSINTALSQSVRGNLRTEVEILPRNLCLEIPVELNTFNKWWLAFLHSAGTPTLKDLPSFPVQSN